MNGVTILTGATSGIGAAIATEIGHRGPLLLVGRRRAEGEALAARLPQATFFAADLSDHDAPEKIVAAAAALGPITGLINNAGVLEAGTAEATTNETWNWIMDINVNAVFRMSRAVIGPMREAIRHAGGGTRAGQARWCLSMVEIQQGRERNVSKFDCGRVAREHRCD